MKIDDWFKIIIILLCGTLIIHQIIQDTQINQRPTRAEVQSMIEGDTLSIYSKNYQAFIESYTLVQALILKGDLPVEELQPYIDWLVERNEMRIEEDNEKFGGER